MTEMMQLYGTPLSSKTRARLIIEIRNAPDQVPDRSNQELNSASKIDQLRLGILINYLLIQAADPYDMDSLGRRKKLRFWT